MTITQEELIRMVRVELDRNRLTTPLIHPDENDPDTLELDDIIRQQMLPALRLCLERASVDKLQGAMKKLPATKGGIYTFTKRKHVYYIDLPEDFLRLGLFQMADWAYGITEVITDDDPRAALLGSDYAGIGGNEEQPYVLLTWNEEGKRILVIFASEDGDTASAKALYIAEPQIDENGRIDVPSRIEAALVSMIAAMTLRVLQDQTGVTLLEQKAMALLGYNTNNR